MTGTIVSIPNNTETGKPANWCFIKGEDGKEYFLHISELFDRWDMLKAKLSMDKKVKINFEPTMGQKGPRAIGAAIISDEIKDHSPWD